MPHATLITDDTGVVLRANSAAVALLGPCEGRLCSDLVGLCDPSGQPHCTEHCATALALAQHRTSDQRGVVRGKPARVLCGAVGRHLVITVLPQPKVGQESLTPREVQVLSLVAEGLTGTRIAERLEISRATVRTHIEHAREKLHSVTRAEAVARAMALGLIGA